MQDQSSGSGSVSDLGIGENLGPGSGSGAALGAPLCTGKKSNLASDLSSANLVDFFLVAAPGLEDIVLTELHSWLPGVEAKLVRGGIEVQLPMAVGLRLNRLLKTPSRILLRIAQFGCRDFPKLFKKISGLPWHQWLGNEIVTVEFEASTHASRLRIKKRIEKTCLDGFFAFQKKIQSQPSQTQGRSAVRVLVRFNDDVCTLSLDTSGELLHKRGVKTLSGEAPLRENIAACLLLLLGNAAEELLGVSAPTAAPTTAALALTNTSSPALNSAPATATLTTAVPTRTPSSSPKIELVDPMMGTGTFLIEARDLRRSITTRSFAFEQIEALRKLEADLPPIENFGQSFEFDSFRGFESDAKTFQDARENLLSETKVHTHCVDFFAANPLNAAGTLDEAGLLEARSSFDAGTVISLDSLTSSEAQSETQPEASSFFERWLIVNPPYGERLKIEGTLAAYYTRLCQRVESVVMPKRALFLLPAKARVGAPGEFLLHQVHVPASWQKIAERRFLNGGLPVVAHVFQRIS